MFSKYASNGFIIIFHVGKVTEHRPYRMSFFLTLAFILMCEIHGLLSYFQLNFQDFLVNIYFFNFCVEEASDGRGYLCVQS